MRNSEDCAAEKPVFNISFFSPCRNLSNAKVFLLFQMNEDVHEQPSETLARQTTSLFYSNNVSSFIHNFFFQFFFFLFRFTAKFIIVLFFERCKKTTDWFQVTITHKRDILSSAKTKPKFEIPKFTFCTQQKYQLVEARVFVLHLQSDVSRRYVCGIALFASYQHARNSKTMFLRKRK